MSLPIMGKPASQFKPEALTAAKALRIRIEILEAAFNNCDAADEERLYHIQIELGIAYKEFMTNASAIQFIKLSNVS